MKSIILVLIIFLSLYKVEAQEEENLFQIGKGLLLEASIDANPRFWGDWKVTSGWRFEGISIYGSYESFKEISFEAYYLGFLAHSQPFENSEFESNLLKRISTGLGACVGIVNGEFGLEVFGEGTFWISSHFGTGFQAVLSQNNSLGGSYETRYFIRYVF
jgi:hypothetical protein